MRRTQSHALHLIQTLAVFLLALVLAACGSTISSDASGAAAAPSQESSAESSQDISVTEGSPYTTKEEVAAYLHEYGELPPNFITKTEARRAGWDPGENTLDEVCPGKSIGGSVFYNDDGKLPDAPGRTWHECDIDYEGGSRGAERLVYSTDGLIYYTPDHYETFEELY